MVNKIDIIKNSEVIMKALNKEDRLSITDMVNRTNLSRGQIRVSLPYLIGTEKINEIKYGMAKVYFLK